MKSSSLLFALCLSVPVAAWAQTTDTPRVDQRQVNQEARIQQGVQSGTLTEKEAARMEKGQAHVQKVEDRVKADGVVTKQERARLHQAQDVQSQKIYRQKHDRQTDFNHNGANDRAERRATRKG